MNGTKERVYTVKEIAFQEKVSEDTVYRWCVQNYLQFERNPTCKGQGRITIKESDYNYFKESFKKNT